MENQINLHNIFIFSQKLKSNNFLSSAISNQRVLCDCTLSEKKALKLIVESWEHMKLSSTQDNHKTLLSQKATLLLTNFLQMQPKAKKKLFCLSNVHFVHSQELPFLSLNENERTKILCFLHKCNIRLMSGKGTDLFNLRS